MARTTVLDTVLILDDELYNLTWMVDFLESQGLKTMTFSDANSIVPEINSEIYRCLVLDLNVPVYSPLDVDAESRGHVYRQYPGLYIAWLARNRGYRGRQVLVYSVHKDEGVEAETDRLGCTYIRKGRPREVKSELEQVLSYDPTSDN